MPSVVVGAGILGAIMAFELVSRGHHVTLFEAETIASGASGGPGTRGLRANYRAVPEVKLAARGGQLWRKYRDTLGLAARFNGSLLVTERHVVGSSAGLTSLEDRAWVQRNHGITTHVVNRDGVRDLEPHLHERISGGLYVPDDGDIDHERATKTFAEAACRAGAVLHEGDPVVDLRVVDHGRTEVVSRKGQRIVADDGVFLFANAGLRELLASCLHVRLPVWRLYPQLVRVRSEHPNLLRHALGHDHRPLTLRPLPDGDLLYAGRWRGRWDDRSKRGMPDPEAARGHLEAGAQTIPALDGAAISEIDASRPDTGSPDGLPIVDALPGGIYFGTGWAGHGYGIAPAVVEALLDWHRARDRPRQLTDLRLERFGVDSSGDLSGYAHVHDRAGHQTSGAEAEQ